MGLLSWLFQKPAFELQPDRIFLTRSAMLNDFVQRCRLAAQAHDRVLLVAHFEDLRRAIFDRLNAERIPAEEAGGQLRSHAVLSELNAKTPTLALAEQLKVDVTALESHDKSPRVVILIAERHPLRGHDDRIEQFAAAMPATARLTYFGSLDSAVYRRFSGDWVADTLKNLGMKPDEVIESQMVARRLIGAQRKIEAAMISDAPADSAEEWCERNLPTS
jgi:hypothetical protein